VNGNFGQINMQQGIEPIDLKMCFVETGTSNERTIDQFYMTYYDFDMGKGGAQDEGEYAEAKAEVVTIKGYANFYLNTDGDLLDDPNTEGKLCELRSDGWVGGDSAFPMYLPPDNREYDGAPTGNDWENLEKDYDEFCTSGASNTAPGDGDEWYDNYPCTEVYVTKISVGANNVSNFTATVRGYGCDNPVSTSTLTDLQAARSVMFEFRNTSCIDITYDIGGGLNSASGRNFLFAGRSFPCPCTTEQFCTPPSAPPLAPP
jgi:hypothetical protein